MATREQQQARRERLKLQGMCACGRYPLTGKSRCEFCSRAHAKSSKLRRKRRIDAGQCVACKNEAPFHTLCDECREAMRLRSERNRLRKNAARTAEMQEVSK